MPSEAWLIFAYLLGSIAGVYCIWKPVYNIAVSTTIEFLVKNDFVRYKEDDEGNIELITLKD